jgi:membrane protein implicated in regulation of membrane protease activity
MDLRSISLILLGTTIVYAGVLSLADDFMIGVGMVILGGFLTSVLAWRAFRRLKPPEDPKRFSTRGKRKTRLTIVEDNKDRRPTYH